LLKIRKSYIIINNNKVGVIIMDIIEKLENISTIEELKEIDSVENIVKEIENMIKPLSIGKEKKWNTKN
jgi:hypothetical protein